jgi:amino acid transporter
LPRIQTREGSAQLTEHSTAPVVGPPTSHAARLEPDAIGVAQDTVIGMASAAPTVSVGLTVAALAATVAYGGGPVIVLCGIPMLIIANAYRRLNLWNANCGASFEWVGRSISPYLGFVTGWLMIAAYITGCVSGVEVLGPSVLAVFGVTTSSNWAYVGIAAAVTLLMLVIAIVGIKITARTQVAMAFVEYAILIGFAIVGLVFVLGHHAGTFPVTRGWFSLSGIGGHGSIAAGLIAAVYIYSGWEGTVYVNEEVKHRRENPGRAAMIAVALLIVIYTLVQMGLQGVVSPAKLNKAGQSGDALVYIANAIGGSGWAKVMALALALSVIAATGTSIVLTARIIYGMGTYRALPSFLANISRRYSTPVAASILTGVFTIVIAAVYLLATSVQGAFSDVVGLSGQLFAAFYILTAIATIVYYRRRVVSSVWNALVLGILPLAAAGFLIWVLFKFLQSTTAASLWSIVGIVAAGIVLMVVARVGLRSPFFALPRESDNAPIPGAHKSR